MIDKLIDKNSIVNTLFNSINSREKITVFGCEKDAKLTLLKESGKSLFFVTNDIKEAVGLKERLVECGYRTEMLMDKLDFKLSPFTCDYNVKVINVLSKIIDKSIDAIIVNPMFLLYNLPKFDWLSSKVFSVEVGQNMDILDLKKQLVKLGFERSDVPQNNEFNIKGDMIDISTAFESVRIYFDYDTISSIKVYDKETLLNTKEIETFSIYPTAWFDIQLNNLDIKNEITLQQLNTYQSKLNNILWCMQYADNIGDTIIDYLNDDYVIGILDTKITTNYLEEEVKN